MTFTFNHGDNLVDFTRSYMFGSVTIKVNGRVVATRSPLKFGTHYPSETQDKFTFPVGSSEVMIQHERPRIFAGLLPQTFRVFVDGQLTEEHTGY